MFERYIQNYFLFLFSVIPICIIIGPSFSLINILLIDLSFLFLIFYKRDFSFIKEKAFIYLLFLYLYLLFNSFISIDPEIGIRRNVGFIRIIILFAAINYFFNKKSFFNKVFLVWLLIISIVSLDIFIESFSGKNILGYGGEAYGWRIVSFFKDEPIVGGYFNSFYLILIGFLYEKLGKKHNNKLLLLSIIFFVSIFLTGERSNTIKAFLGIMFFYVFFREYPIKKKIILIISGLIIVVITILNTPILKNRYISQIKASFSENQKYFNLYKSGYEVFKNNLIFGVGNKNYRIVACSKEFENEIKSTHYVCNTHPHQIYFEFLSEHGILGSIIILFVFYKLIFEKFLVKFRDINYIQLGSSIYLMLVFLPLLPSGAFFGDYSITLFGLNLAIFYSVNSKFNIFSGYKKENKIEN